MGQKHEINTSDATSIALYSYAPVDKAKAVIIIASAMGTTQSYYRALAEWLAGHGYHAYTFDYRSVGESQDKHLRHYSHTILDWAEHDCSAVLAHVRAQHSDEPLIWLGHSLGGQIFPLVEGIEHIDKVITVASGTGYWRDNAPQLRKKIRWFWFLLVPISLRVFGYFPGKKLGMVGDLPRSVMAQWRRWCLHPKYCVGVEDQDVEARFADISMPIRCLAMADDEMLSSRNIEALFHLYGSDDKSITTVKKDKNAGRRIGHLGYFRKEGAENLWPATLLPELP